MLRWDLPLCVLGCVMASGCSSDALSVPAVARDGDASRDLSPIRTARDSGTIVDLTPPAKTLSFAAAVNYAVGAQPNPVAIGDLNGDGRLDLAVTNWGSGNASVLLGDGNGTFANAVNYATGTQPLALALGDLDGDGMLDLAVAHDYANY